MELISQHSKKIMEECKLRARDAGLMFDNETIEYIVTNNDLLELSPKAMIPTLYDYWVHDLQVIKGKKEYELYPHNPYETVINSRPALSFYNDNNPDWLNVMIFYHVLAHIDFMQNNCFFKHTWSDDFVGMALADKRLIANLRAEHGRWVDYVIEFTRGIDNIVGYHKELSELNIKSPTILAPIDFFFDVFLQKIKKVEISEYLKHLGRFNKVKKINKKQADVLFLAEIKTNFHEFESVYKKYSAEFKSKPKDVIQYLMANSAFLNKRENVWMKSVMEVVRNTSLYFAPQMRTKVMNEGWASFWHQELFMKDERISGHEADFAKVNAWVTSVPKVGFNPYAIGIRMFEFIKDSAEKGRISYEFDLLNDVEKRKAFNTHTGKGLDYMFNVRKNFCDFTFINTFVKQDFLDKYKLAIIGERINEKRMVKEYYIKSKKAKDYKQLLIGNLIHPPNIMVDEENIDEKKLVLTHDYEGKQLVPEFIENVLIGVEFLWNGSVELETNILKKTGPQKIVYSLNNKTLRTTYVS